MKVTKKGNGMEALKRAIREVKSKQLRVGWGADIKYTDDKGGEGERVAVIAAQNEFGNPAKNIPPRPFMRPTVNANKTKWMTTAAKGISLALRDQRSIADVMDAIGQLAAGDIRKTISKITSPALSPTTIELRRRRRNGEKITGKTVGEAYKAASSAFFQAGSSSESKPLVETGYMLNSLSSEVVNK